MKLTCPVCTPGGSGDNDHLLRSGYALKKCRLCGLVYLAEVSQNVEDLFFEDARDSAAGPKITDEIEYWSYPQFHERHRSIFDHFFYDRWQKISSAGKHIDRLLDVGCGYGFFLEFLKDYVPNLMGIDINRDVVAYASGIKKLNVRLSHIEDFHTEHLYDCVVMCDVLEHVMDPNHVLSICHDLLTPQGALFIQVPNLTGFRLPPNHSWGLPHHIWQFGPKNLKQLLMKNGFAVLHWHTGVMGVIGEYENGGPSLMKRVQWAMARRLKIGNRLQMVAIKEPSKKTTRATQRTAVHG